MALPAEAQPGTPQSTAGIVLAMPGWLALWFGLLGGFAAFTVQLLVGYLIVGAGCLAGLSDLQPAVHLLSLVALLAAIGAWIVAWRCWRAAGIGEQSETGGARGRTGFMGLGGMLLNTLFLIAIVYNGVTSLAIRPCG